MANLHVVPRQTDAPAQSENEIDDAEKVIAAGLRVTGDDAVDLETAIRAAAFLMEWFETIGVEGLLNTAETVRAFRRETGR